MVKTEDHPGKTNVKHCVKKSGVEITAQLTTIKLHEKCGKHQNMYATSSSTKTIVQAFTSPQGHSNKGDSVKAAEIKLTAMMFDHNISSRRADHLCDIIKEYFPDSAIAKDEKMKRTKCQNMW